MTRFLRRIACLAAIAGFMLGSAPAAAQVPRAAAAASGEAAESKATLRREVGVVAATRLMASADPASLVRGVERLGSIGSNEALEALLDALEQGGLVSRDMRARLTAVRVLAPHARKDRVRAALAKEMIDASTERAPDAELAALLRDSAALALARAGDRKALDVLAGAVLSGGSLGASARLALRAVPPATLAPFIDQKKGLSGEVCAFLGELGDLRALPRLRAALRERDGMLRVAAAVALAELGDEAPLPLARGWLSAPASRARTSDVAVTSGGTTPGGHFEATAGAEVLVRLGAADAPAAVAALLRGPRTRAQGLVLALRAPSPAVAEALVGVWAQLDEEAALAGVQILGRGGGAVPMAQLGKIVAGAAQRPALAAAAAQALAQSADPRARPLLEGLMAASQQAPVRRAAVRAGVVFALLQGDAPAGLDDALRALARSGDAADRGTGAFGMVALGRADVGQWLERACPGAAAGHGSRCDAALVAGIARGALARGPRSLAPLHTLLVRLAERPVADAALLAAAGAGLLASPEAGDVATSRLADWAEGGGALAPLAARALASRDDAVIRPRLQRLLDGSDAAVRAHVAFGLGRDPEPDSVTLLADAYRFEPEASVRRAVVRGLSLRREPQRQRVLALARDLDPDAGVRALAASALRGEALAPAWEEAPRGSPVAWVLIEEVAPSPRSRAARRSHIQAARVTRADGLTVPVLADADGAVLVPGMALGLGAVELAPVAAPADASAVRP
jgi:HEAT repeat protein